MTRRFDFSQAPGHLIRRVQQTSVAHFMQETADWDLTPVQFALLTAVRDAPGIDQARLAERVVLDVATTGSALTRLQAKGWLLRTPDPQDKRRKRMTLTPEGLALLNQVRQAVERTQQRILAPLSEPERVQFLASLKKIADQT